jgi:hypothetical protein
MDTSDFSKGYITVWKRREDPGERDVADYGFDSRPDKAYRWDTKEAAESDCWLFNRFAIEIDSAQGGTHVCKGFEVEKLESGGFAVFCEAPFIRQSTGEEVIDPHSTSLKSRP